MTNMIAGHTFPDFGPCSCGMRWLDIRGTQREEVGKTGVAHTSYLTENEYNQIEAARRAEDDRIEAATAGAGGRSL